MRRISILSRIWILKLFSYLSVIGNAVAHGLNTRKMSNFYALFDSLLTSGLCFLNSNGFQMTWAICQTQKYVQTVLMTGFHEYELEFWSY